MILKTTLVLARFNLKCGIINKYVPLNMLRCATRFHEVPRGSWSSAFQNESLFANPLRLVAVLVTEAKHKCRYNDILTHCMLDVHKSYIKTDFSKAQRRKLDFTHFLILSQREKKENIVEDHITQFKSVTNQVQFSTVAKTMNEIKTQITLKWRTLLG